MNEETGRILENSLLAKELLQNKGISSTAWNEWEKSSRALPKTGKKEFEPNGSLLQNLQIEKDIKNRKDLLSIERVERQSHLAIAEWLPDQKKARVIKKSGQDWNNFGLEINCALYLLPEEALLLLEMSCLELKWNGIPLSLQQAYEILLDNSTCSLEEYRVYSQLVRCGYRIQRFIYSEPEKNSRPDECLKRKVIVDPANGLRIDINKVHASKTENFSTIGTTETVVTSTEQTTGGKIKDPVDRVLLEDNPDKNSLNNQTSSTESVDVAVSEVKGNNSSSKAKSSKVKIISEGTLLGGIKIVKEPSATNVSSWPGMRISRNVKVMPKRTDKPSCSATFPSTVNNNPHKDTENKPVIKRKISTSNDNSDSKKSKQEVIELSDEEIEEVPRPMTRMEMLHLLPDIAKKSVIIEKIPRRYIPPNIKPQNNVYQYERSKLLNAQGKEKITSFNSNKTVNRRYNDRRSHQNFIVPFRNQNHHRHVHNTNVYHVERRQFTGVNSVIYNNRLPFDFQQNIYMHQRIFQQHIFQNMLNYVGYHNVGHSTFHQNRCLSIQMNNFSNTSIIQRNCSVQTPFQQNVYQNVSLHERFYQRGMILNMSSDCDTSRNSFTYAQQNSDYRSLNDYDNPRSTTAPKEGFSKPSFTTYPGSTSWGELKKRWREEKTITIDDEESTNRDAADSSEVEVVHYSINPLVGPKNARSLAEVYNRLRIIKSAPEKMVRKKRSSYKISYNVFSSTQHYRKSNPGEPLCRIVVLRKNDNLIIQPIELSRLQQDAAGVPIIVAYVCMSISYIQPGVVSLPDLTE